MALVVPLYLLSLTHSLLSYTTGVTPTGLMQVLGFTKLCPNLCSAMFVFMRPLACCLMCVPSFFFTCNMRMTMQSHRAFKKIKDNNIWHLRQNQYSARVISLATLKQVDNLLLLILLCFFPKSQVP